MPNITLNCVWSAGVDICNIFKLFGAVRDGSVFANGICNNVYKIFKSNILF